MSDTVYLLLPEPGLAGNLAVSAGEDGILIVDDAMVPVAPKIKAAVAKIQEGRIDFVVNSHYHFDHAGGNAAFGADSAIVAHANVRKRLLENRHAGANFSATPFPSEALPIVTFNESVTLHWNGEAIDVIHFGNPAHTDGDVAIFFRDSNVVHAGDQFPNLGGYPYIDRDVGGSALGLRDNMAQLLKIVDDETKIIPVTDRWRRRPTCRGTTTTSRRRSTTSTSRRAPASRSRTFRRTACPRSSRRTATARCRRNRSGSVTSGPASTTRSVRSAVAALTHMELAAYWVCRPAIRARQRSKPGPPCPRRRA